MLVDANTLPHDTVLDTDVCIVGGGAAGITLARALGRDHDVVVLESGGVEGNPETQDLMVGPNVGLPYFALVASRLRYLGGSTNHWGGVCRRMTAMDLERNPAVPGTGWPIALADLEEHYEEAEELCGLRTPGQDPEEIAAADASAPVLGESDGLATRVAQMVEVRHRSFATRYLDELREASRVQVVLWANVLELVTDGAGGPVTEVTAATLEGRALTVRPRVTVLAAGGIENARVLLLSDRHQTGGLGNQHDLVGRYFLEHPRFLCARVTPSGGWVSTKLYEWHDVGDARIQGYLAVPDDRRREEGLSDVQLRVRPSIPTSWTDDDEAVEAGLRLRRRVIGRRTTGDLRDDVVTVAGDVMSWSRAAVPGAPLPVPQPAVVQGLLDAGTEPPELVPQVLGSVLAHAYRQSGRRTPIHDLEITGRFEPVPNPDSRVVLTRERDALGQRRVALDWRLTGDDKANLVRSLEVVGAELARTGVGQLQVTVDDAGDSWPEDLEGGWHHIGTTRMSPDPRRGVVDPDCRVHGVANLYVAGSSVFPTAGSGTPTLTLVALALRLAGHLRGVLA